MGATKQQEREALAKIEKIVASLGDDSYIAAAFEGCFDIARENIENDFACSMKQQRDSAQEALQKAKDYISEIEREHTKYKKNAEEVTQELAHQLDALRLGAIDDETRKEIIARLCKDRTNYAEKEHQYGAEVLEHLEQPESAEYRGAKEEYLEAKFNRESIEKLIDALRKNA